MPKKTHITRDEVSPDAKRVVDALDQAVLDVLTELESKPLSDEQKTTIARRFLRSIVAAQLLSVASFLDMLGVLGGTAPPSGHQVQLKTEGKTIDYTIGEDGES